MAIERFKSIETDAYGSVPMRLWNSASSSPSPPWRLTNIILLIALLFWRQASEATPWAEMFPDSFPFSQSASQSVRPSVRLFVRVSLLNSTSLESKGLRVPLSLLLGLCISVLRKFSLTRFVSILGYFLSACSYSYFTSMSFEIKNCVLVRLKLDRQVKYHSKTSLAIWPHSWLHLSVNLTEIQDQ